MDITLPKASQVETPDHRRMPTEIIVNIKKDGVITINGNTITTEVLKSRLGLLVNAVAEGSGIQPVVILRADKKTQYENVVKIMDICRELGIGDFTLATLKNETPNQ